MDGIRPQEIGTKLVPVNGRAITVHVFESLEAFRRRMGLVEESDVIPYRPRESRIRRRNLTGPLAELWR